jgi:hypothetical protein
MHYMNWVKNKILFIAAIILFFSCNQKDKKVGSTDSTDDTAIVEEKLPFNYAMLYTQRHLGKRILWCYQPDAQKNEQLLTFNISPMVQFQNLYFSEDLKTAHYLKGDSLCKKTLANGQEILINTMPKAISALCERIWHNETTDEYVAITYHRPGFEPKQQMSELARLSACNKDSFVINVWHFNGENWVLDSNIITQDGGCDYPGFAKAPMPKNGHYYFTIPQAKGVEYIRNWIESPDTNVGFVNSENKETPLVFNELDSMNENGMVFVKSEIEGNYSFSFDLVGYVGKGVFAVFDPIDQSIDFMRNQDFIFDVMRFKNNRHEYLIYSSSKSDFLIDLSDIKNLVELPESSDNFKFIKADFLSN